MLVVALTLMIIIRYQLNMDTSYSYSDIPFKSYIRSRFTHIAYLEYNSGFDQKERMRHDIVRTLI